MQSRLLKYFINMKIALAQWNIYLCCWGSFVIINTSRFDRRSLREVVRIGPFIWTSWTILEKTNAISLNAIEASEINMEITLAQWNIYLCCWGSLVIINTRRFDWRRLREVVRIGPFIWTSWKNWIHVHWFILTTYEKLWLLPIFEEKWICNSTWM